MYDLFLKCASSTLNEFQTVVELLFSSKFDPKNVHAYPECVKFISLQQELRVIFNFKQSIYPVVLESKLDYYAWSELYWRWLHTTSILVDIICRKKSPRETCNLLEDYLSFILVFDLFLPCSQCQIHYNENKILPFMKNITAHIANSNTLIGVFMMHNFINNDVQNKIKEEENKIDEKNNRRVTLSKKEFSILYCVLFPENYKLYQKEQIHVINLRHACELFVISHYLCLEPIKIHNLLLMSDQTNSVFREMYNYIVNTYLLRGDVLDILTGLRVNLKKRNSNEAREVLLADKKTERHETGLLQNFEITFKHIDNPCLLEIIMNMFKNIDLVFKLETCIPPIFQEDNHNNMDLQVFNFLKSIHNNLRPSSIMIEKTKENFKKIIDFETKNYNKI